MIEAVKPKKIVVFSANGGIGKSTVEEIVRQMSLLGNKNQPVEIWLLAREGEKGENRAKGIAMDLRDQMALDIAN